MLPETSLGKKRQSLMSGNFLKMEQMNEKEMPNCLAITLHYLVATESSQPGPSPGLALLLHEGITKSSPLPGSRPNIDWSVQNSIQAKTLSRAGTAVKGHPGFRTAHGIDRGLRLHCNQQLNFSFSHPSFLFSIS